jgi:hypothetical protein
MRPSSIPIREGTLIAVVVTALSLPEVTAAQSLDLVRISPVEAHLPLPLSDPRTSLRVLSSLRRTRPRALDLHLAAAREAAALGVTSETPELRAAWLETAGRAAEAALALDSSRADAHYWLAVTLGLQADQAGIRARISLAREAYNRARRTLELDPTHGGGNHIVGRLHAAAKRLSWTSRIIARGLGLGETLDDASWEGAEHHMRVAVAQDPDQLVHRYELGKLLIEARGKADEGYAILRGLAQHKPRHDLDAHYVRLAKEVLGDLAPTKDPGR